MRIHIHILFSQKMLIYLAEIAQNVTFDSVEIYICIFLFS